MFGVFLECSPDNFMTFLASAIQLNDDCEGVVSNIGRDEFCSCMADIMFERLRPFDCDLTYPFNGELRTDNFYQMWSTRANYDCPSSKF